MLAAASQISRIRCCCSTNGATSSSSTTTIRRRGETGGTNWWSNRTRRSWQRYIILITSSGFIIIGLTLLVLRNTVSSSYYSISASTLWLLQQQQQPQLPVQQQPEEHHHHYHHHHHDTVVLVVPPVNKHQVDNRHQQQLASSSSLSHDATVNVSHASSLMGHSGSTQVNNKLVNNNKKRRIAVHVFPAWGGSTSTSVKTDTSTVAKDDTRAYGVGIQFEHVLNFVLWTNASANQISETLPYVDEEINTKIVTANITTTKSDLSNSNNKNKKMSSPFLSLSPPISSSLPNFPITLYTINEHGVYTSNYLRSQNERKFIKDRLQPTEAIMIRAWHILKREKGGGGGAVGSSNKSKVETATRSLQNSDIRWTNDTDTQDRSVSGQQKPQQQPRWHRLYRAVTKEGGFFFLAYYGDYRSCNYRNWKQQYSIPLFTTCARMNCHYAWPLPTYKTIQQSKSLAVQWNATFQQQDIKYPCDKKIPKVIWRGSLTGPLENYTNPRWRLCQHATMLNRKDLLDIGLVRVPPRHDRHKLDLSLVGGLVPSISPMDSFQQYMAILDIDGNSWSSRFGGLLCYNSIILKVQPTYVDYFHFKYLEPWKHYIPIKADLSDLVEKVQWVTNYTNRYQTHQIIENAREFCRRQMTTRSLALDYLDIWESYVRMLDRGDQSTPVVLPFKPETNTNTDTESRILHQWTKTWNETVDRIFMNPNGYWNMMKLGESTSTSTSSQGRSNSPPPPSYPRKGATTMSMMTGKK